VEWTDWLDHLDFGLLPCQRGFPATKPWSSAAMYALRVHSTSNESLTITLIVLRGSSIDLDLFSSPVFSAIV
jgi:hypothetical protein